MRFKLAVSFVLATMLALASVAVVAGQGHGAGAGAGDRVQQMDRDRDFDRDFDRDQDRDRDRLHDQTQQLFRSHGTRAFLHTSAARSAGTAISRPGSPAPRTATGFTKLTRAR